MFINFIIHRSPFSQIPSVHACLLNPSISLAIDSLSNLAERRELLGGLLPLVDEALPAEYNIWATTLGSKGHTSIGDDAAVSELVEIFFSVQRGVNPECL